MDCVGLGNVANSVFMLQKTKIFGRELSRIIPNSLTRFRQRCSLKRIIKDAAAKNFTDIVIVNENQSQPSILFLLTSLTIFNGCLCRILCLLDYLTLIHLLTLQLCEDES